MGDLQIRRGTWGVVLLQLVLSVLLAFPAHAGPVGCCPPGDCCCPATACLPTAPPCVSLQAAAPLVRQAEERPAPSTRHRTVARPERRPSQPAPDEGPPVGPAQRGLAPSRHVLPPPV